MGNYLSWRGAFVVLHMAGCDHLRAAKEKIWANEKIRGIPSDVAVLVERIRAMKSASRAFGITAWTVDLP